MTYVLSDIHGNLQRFKSIMAQINLQADDTLYVLGDVIDRYAGGIKILRQIMRMPNAEMLIGNHEYMPEDIKAMLGGEKQDIRIDGVIYAAYELLDMEVVDMQADLFNNGLIRMKADETDGQTFVQTM